MSESSFRKRVRLTKHSVVEVIAFSNRSGPVRSDTRTISFYGRRLSTRKSRVSQPELTQQNGCHRTTFRFRKMSGQSIEAVQTALCEKAAYCSSLLEAEFNWLDWRGE